MARGILAVMLINARGLANTDFLGGMDPYVVIQYQTQKRNSSVAQAGEGRNPEWNETHTFKASYPGTSDEYKLTFRIMDKDTFTADDFVGEAVIHVKDLISLGVEEGKAEIHPRKYSVVCADGSYRGELQVGVSFTLSVEREMDEEELGGWKQSY